MPINDPSVVIPLMASVTTALGFVLTSNIIYEHPLSLARRLASLGQLTDGRLGWNIVTGYLDSAARAMGLVEQIDHDLRFELAERAIREVCGHLNSFKQSHTCGAGDHRIPLLFQAGASLRGHQFAAGNADCVLLPAISLDATKAAVMQLRELCTRANRKPSDMKIFRSLSVIVGRTDAEAQKKFREYRRYFSPVASLAHWASAKGSTRQKLSFRSIHRKRRRARPAKALRQFRKALIKRILCNNFINTELGHVNAFAARPVSQ